MSRYQSSPKINHHYLAQLQVAIREESTRVQLSIALA